MATDIDYHVLCDDVQEARGPFGGWGILVVGAMIVEMFRVTDGPSIPTFSRNREKMMDCLDALE